jgi:CubicO group peptidase (beta-lactamase class C family)
VIATRRLRSVDDVVRAAYEARRFTGAVVRVERAGTVVFEAAYGTTGDPADGAREVEVAVDTRFDLASLTKLFVATAALRAADAGRLPLDEPLTFALPEWRGTAHERITARMLLAHLGGLRSGADYRTLFAEDVQRFALTLPLVAAPGERVIYSDLGFISLGIALARASGRSLARVVEESARALGALDFAYAPRGRAREAIPATEHDAWRGRVRGVVHDEKAYLLGSVAGHAGGFGTAYDVARLTDAYLAVACERANDGAPISRELASEAVREWGADSVLRRGLGWALKTLDENSCGRAMSFATFGHTGFTGTCVWADPARDLSVTLLTNAVYFGRGDLREVRAAVCDAAVQAYG